jgi:hypothetical protein
MRSGQSFQEVIIENRSGTFIVNLEILHSQFLVLAVR